MKIFIIVLINSLALLSCQNGEKVDAVSKLKAYQQEKSLRTDTESLVTEPLKSARVDTGYKDSIEQEILITNHKLQLLKKQEENYLSKMADIKNSGKNENWFLQVGHKLDSLESTRNYIIQNKSILIKKEAVLDTNSSIALMEIELQEEQKQDLIRSLADEKSIDNISAYIQLQKDKITNLKKEKNLLLRKINEKEYTLINIDEEITRLKQVLDNSYSRKAVLSEYLDSEKQRAEITMEQLITEKEFLLRKKENLMSELIETRKMKQQGEKKVSKKEERVQNENLIPQTEQEPTGGSGIPGLFIGSLIIVIIILISLFFIGKNTSKLKTN